MTIGIGMICGGNLVLAADSEVTSENFMKGQQSKLRCTLDAAVPSVGKQGCLALTYAGPSEYLDAIHQQIGGLFKARPNQSLFEFKAEFEDWLKNFHRQHVTPYGSDQEFWLIVAARRDGYVRMWSTAKDVVTEVSNFAAIGIGHMQAMGLLRQLWFAPDHWTARALAVYVLSRVKRTTPGCGGSTEVVSILDDTLIDPWNQRAVVELEAIFERYARLEAKTVHWILGGTDEWANRGSLSEAAERIKESVATILAAHGKPTLI